MLINLTQHEFTKDQVIDAQQFHGVVNLNADRKVWIKELLTFSFLPTNEEIVYRAKELAKYAKMCLASHAMIGGAPYLMVELAKALKEEGIVPLYSFTERVSEEHTNDDGTVVKTNVFKHVGWVGL